MPTAGNHQGAVGKLKHFSVDSSATTEKQIVNLRIWKQLIPFHRKIIKKNLSD
jgi:uncharacterized protein (UPF0248 family)